jgi:hypothetical protein
LLNKLNSGKMKLAKVLILGTVLFMGCTTTQINNTTDAIGKVLNENAQVSTEEVGRGLKEALVQGISKGSAQASQIDGYFKNSMLKILMPPDMQKVDQKLRSLGFNKLMDDFELSLNRGAEEAAKEAKPIFINAITSMSIQDAWNILKGEQDAATVYLKRTTSSQLYNAFKPVIQTSLQKVNATKYYTDIITRYNKLPLVEKVNPNLDDYVTNKAIDGLFVLVKQEEANIRSNPAARVSDLLKRVFTSENMQK